MRNINISEQEIDNSQHRGGEAMSQPEYRVVQALLATSRSEDATTVAAKEAYVDDTLSKIENGAAFEQAVSGTEPFAFSGGDLGWRKLGDIPSMFADAVPQMEIGEVSKVRSSSGFHLVYLADATGGERLVKQTKVRHILITPTEVLSEMGAEGLAGQLKERAEAGEAFADLARQYSTTSALLQRGELGWTNPGQMVPEFEATMAAIPLNTISDPFRSEFGWHILEVTDRRDKDFFGNSAKSGRRIY